MAFKKNLLALLDECEHGQNYGVVQANVGQKLLIYYPLRVFSGDQ
jgi:hypothetical protein